VIGAQWLVRWATTATDTPKEELLPDHLDSRVLLLLPISAQLDQVLVADREHAPVRIDLDPHAIARTLLSTVGARGPQLEVTLDGEAGRGLAQQRGQATLRQRERLRGKPTNRRAQRVGQRSLRAPAREHLQRVQHVALARSVRSRKDRESRQLELNVDEGLEALDGDAAKHATIILRSLQVCLCETATRRPPTTA
jgi:hypothetical protein